MMSQVSDENYNEENDEMEEDGSVDKLDDENLENYQANDESQDYNFYESDEENEIIENGDNDKEHNSGNKEIFKDESSQHENEREELDKNEYDDFLKKHFNIACQKCNLPFDTFKHYVKHCRQVHKERGYVTCCDTKFQFRKTLVDHIQYHLNAEYFKCSHCGKCFYARSYLRIHKELHEEGKFACKLCNKKFPRKYMLRKHHQKKHVPPPEKTIPCEDCGKLYTCQRTLQYHRKHVHLKHFSRVCEICGQTLPTLFAYQQHKLRHNPNPVRCEDCGLLVTSQVTLK
ncbi:transcription factor grauzone-like [Musca autumnalis]|uniref:transcription factor grauzone-like n=1 Tax=Musca autumnalis TaxID=221902 RepID=UPI003CFB9BAB